MDTNSVLTISERPARQKPKQMYLHFRLRPEDDVLLELLPPRQRDLLESEGSYKERAQKLGLPIGTLRSGLHRARAALERLRLDRGEDMSRVSGMDTS